MAPSSQKDNLPNNTFNTNENGPRISVVGVGGAGGNAINNMIRAKLEGVDFFAANTDSQALDNSLVPAEKRLTLGMNITQGLGAGSKAEVGRASAEESIDEMIAYLQGSNMVFITAGMGGGTGTGAAPVIARASRESGILTVGVVSKPFHFEGSHRMRTAEKGIEELQKHVDTLIIIPNQNLFRIANEKTTFADAFKMADDVLYSGVRGVTDLMIMPGLINLDFADIRSVMGEMGKAMMGTGEAEGDRRALDAAEAAISNPLLDDVSMKGARGVLINITGGYDMTLYEVDEAANRIRDDIDSDANIIFGSTFDEKLNGRMRVSVVATGIGAVTQTISVPQNAPLQQNVTQTDSFTPQAPSFNHFTTQTPQHSDSQFSDPVAPGLNMSDENKEQETRNPEKKFQEQEEITLKTEESVQKEQTTESPIFNALKSEEYSSTKERKPSLFERFTGARNKPATQNQGDSTQPDTSESSEADENADYLDIPSFLRRNNS
ncbi:MAG: cell division protein FtsZ [Alphaproteobacteria bacterium CG_4_10_14_0_8_um_filter_37_21]|nr:MAG: cell division protein FtsZ [Alphaproteobacteria bacterium CG_4_10_14_0_8_um_filter_37_21]